MKKILVILLTVSILLSLGCGRDNSGMGLARGFARNAVMADNVREESLAMETSATPVVRSMGSAVYGEADMGSPRRRTPQSAPLTSGDSATNVPQDYERKLIKTASVSIRVDNIETAEKTIAEMLSQYEAYSASTSAMENSRYYSIRVPVHFYDTFLAAMNGMGRMLNRFESTEDVTLRYYDLEGRLATRQELLRTYQSYLGRARNIEEILAVESKINELQYEIEFTGTQLRNLANRVEYATIDLNILGPIAAEHRPQGLTFGEKIKQLFGGFGGFLASVAVGIVGFVIYGIPILAILVLLFWLLFGKVGLVKKLIAKIK